MSGNKKNIDWNDFNWPPLVKVMHFKLDELEGNERTIARNLWLTHLAIFLISIINIINSIA